MSQLNITPGISIPADIWFGDGNKIPNFWDINPITNKNLWATVVVFLGFLGTFHQNPISISSPGHWQAIRVHVHCSGGLPW